MLFAPKISRLCTISPNYLVTKCKIITSTLEVSLNLMSLSFTLQNSFLVPRHICGIGILMKSKLTHVIVLSC